MFQCPPIVPMSFGAPEPDHRNAWNAAPLTPLPCDQPTTWPELLISQASLPSLAAGEAWNVPSEVIAPPDGLMNARRGASGVPSCAQPTTAPASLMPSA